MNGKTTDELPKAFHLLLLELVSGKRIQGYYTAGNGWWPAGWRADDGTYLRSEQIRSWRYVKRVESK